MKHLLKMSDLTPAEVAHILDVADELKTGDVIEADLEKGTVTVNGEVKQFNPLSENVRKTLEYGGLIPRVRAELGIEG